MRSLLLTALLVVSAISLGYVIGYLAHYTYP